MRYQADVDLVNDAPAIWRMRVPFSNLGSGESNCYFVRSGEEWLVVDPGAYSLANREAFIRACFSIGVDFGRCAVFLTHMHFDHAQMLRYVFPARTPVFAMRCGVMSHTPFAQKASRQDFARFMAAFGANADDVLGYASCDAEVAFLDPGLFDVRYVSHGDDVFVGDVLFRVMATPGHTADHACLVAADGGIMFGGDAVCANLTPSIDISRGGEDTFARFEDSLLRVDALGPRLLLPGHNDVLTSEEVHSHVERICEKKHAKLEAVRRATAACGFGTGNDIAHAFAGCGRSQWRSRAAISRYYVMLETAVMLRHLEECGEVDREFDKGGAVYRYRLRQGC